MSDNIIYYIEDIIELLKSDTDINVIAFASMLHHTSGIEAAIEYLHSDGVTITGYVFIGSHNVTGYHITEDNFASVTGKYDIRIGKGSPQYKKKENITLKQRLQRKFRPKEKFGSGRTLYVIGVPVAFGLAVLLKKHGFDCAFVCIDNGTASYTDPYKLSIYYSDAYGNKKNKLKFEINKYRNLIKTAFTQGTLNKWNRKKRIIDLRLYKYSNGKIVRNEISSPYYRLAYRDDRLDERTRDVFESCVLLNTQCLKENNMTDGVLDLEVYRQAVQIIRKYNDKVVLKPHPREQDADKYDALGCTVYKNQHITQETILSSIDKLPTCIISISSSTLLNTAGLFDIPAISLAKIILKSVDNKAMKEHTENYISQVGDFVLFPESFEEFESLIAKYCRG